MTCMLTKEQAMHLLQLIDEEKYSGEPFEYIDIGTLRHIIESLIEDNDAPKP